MALTVKMKCDILHLGVLYLAGSSPVLADDLARQWVYEGRAAMVSTDTQPLQTPMMWSDMTGGSVRTPSGGTVGKYNPSKPAVTFLDSSGTPGNVTNNTARGRAAFAAGASTVVITSSLVTASSMIIINLRTTDATLTFVETAISVAGSFTVSGNAAATGTTAFDFLVIN